MLVLPYLLKGGAEITRRLIVVLGDTLTAGQGGEPSGLASVAEEEEVVHPALDPRVSGLGEEESDAQGLQGDGQADRGGRKHPPARPLGQYGALLEGMGIKLTPRETAIRYYRELALPHLVRFPERRAPRGGEPLPEGVDRWELGDPLEEVDWFESLMIQSSPIPGVTLLRRTPHLETGEDPHRRPWDLYLGIDCSGSMPNPQQHLSYPVLAGVIMALSALRAGAKVMVTLSGDPGKFSATEGFIREEALLMETLTGYLGTGYAFGIRHLPSAFAGREAKREPAHLLIITDSDIFTMLDETKGGWELAQEARKRAGSGSYILHDPAKYARNNPRVERMKQEGWEVYFLEDWEHLIDFAREFSRRHYQMVR